ncbi:MAG: nucleotidyltransferase [Firmicutes bacterium]|nr:nucleotidyltransferase [Bacillota bacterium]
MKIVGIICEYNPFHNGHLYHLQKVKELYPNSLIILILNGYFLERGEVSIISKKDKTNIALLEGIDIVVELPFVYGTQSADIFANASITMLEKLGCEYVIFGSECNDLDTLHKITDYTLYNKDEYNSNVKKYLAEGLNYPTALAKAINIEFDFNSNDLLGISYLKSIKLNKYNIKPITIKRTNNYLDIDSNEEIISASNIRNKLINNIEISKYVPKITLSFIKNISFNDFFKTIKYKIITEKDLSIYLDVDEGIENRLKKVINECENIDELIEKTKSKRYTYNKIRRMLVHILIGFTKEDNFNLTFDYIKILGFNDNGKKHLNKIKKNLKIPITPFKESLTYQYELKAAAIYDLVSKDNNLEFETNNKPIKF